jgi:hypothetical protein
MSFIQKRVAQCDTFSPMLVQCDKIAKKGKYGQRSNYKTAQVF